MSLINKMLRDLDARGGDGSRADMSSLVRPVSHGGRAVLSPLAIGAGVVALAVLGAGGLVAWKAFRSSQHAAAPQLAPAQPIVQKNGPVAAASADEGPPIVPGDIAPEAHRAAGQELARRMEQRNAAARGLAVADQSHQSSAVKPERAAAADKGRPATRPASGKKQGAAKPVRAATSAAGPVAAAPRPADVAETGLSLQQKAENEYRRALTKLQDARVSEALAALEHALELNPRHEAARQTLIGLLVEGGRNSEAVRQLTLATNLDPRQANLAMLLARLQLEAGGNALETLQRSLPYAESNPEYRAMMAGVLQRANRHTEAVDHYQAAVRLQPANAVWWMGLGISLQAEKRNAEAKSAFQRALGSGRLSPELQGFVERRLQQLD